MNKKLTYLEFERLANISPYYTLLYDAIFPYLADEQPELKVCTGCGHKSTDPINKKHLACCPDSNYITLDDYLINSIYRPLARTQFTALGSTTLNPPTKPEPSRLEVAAMILANNLHIGAPQALRDADELIKQAKG